MTLCFSNRNEWGIMAWDREICFLESPGWVEHLHEVGFNKCWTVSWILQGLEVQGRG